MLILGVALVGLAQGVTVALQSSKESELQTTAAVYAAGLVETLRAERALEDGVKEGECGEGLSLYRWRQTIAAASPDGLHNVDISIENAKTGKPIYELRTLLFQASEDPTPYGRGKSGSKRSANR
jgi:Tfp pilus assembly protein PilV